jgi:hypothetical protein
VLVVLHAPVWATLLIAIVPILLILGIVLAIWGEDNPDNSTVHHSGDDDGSDEDKPPERYDVPVAA